MRIKFESEEIAITGDYCGKSDSSKTPLPWFRNLCDKHHYHCSSFSFVWKGRYFYTCFSVLCVIAFHKVYVAMLWIDRRLCIFSKFCKGEYWCYRGTQRQFSENICSEDDLRSRIFGTFVVKFLACLPLLRFSSI